MVSSVHEISTSAYQTCRNVRASASKIQNLNAVCIHIHASTRELRILRIHIVHLPVQLAHRRHGAAVWSSREVTKGRMEERKKERI